MLSCLGQDFPVELDFEVLDQQVGTDMWDAAACDPAFDDESGPVRKGGRTSRRTLRSVTKT